MVNYLGVWPKTWLEKIASSLNIPEAVVCKKIEICKNLSFSDPVHVVPIDARMSNSSASIYVYMWKRKVLHLCACLLDRRMLLTS